MADKTEAPTPKRREQARSKGMGVGRSHEFQMGLTLGVGVIALSSLLPGAASRIVSETQQTIVAMDPHMPNAQLLAHLGGAITVWVSLILPLALFVMVAGVVGNVASGGLVLSLKAVRFDLTRINPLTGMRRLIDKQALVRLGLSVAKLAILAILSWQMVWSRLPTILATQGASVQTIAGSALQAIFQLGLMITILLAVVALIDFVVQRRRAVESMKMTKDEVKQEYKEMEGDPQVKGARKRRARQMAFARMMDAIPTSDVVVTNPTTLAVALKYDSLTMRAPKIVAKGQRLMAERIKQVAREHGVPIVEDKPLARALFPRPIGAEVPAHLYRAVARLLVLVHQTRFGVANGPRGARRGELQPAWAAAESGPWWAQAGASVGRPVPEDETAALFGRIEGGAISEGAPFAELAGSGRSGSRAVGGGDLDGADLEAAVAGPLDPEDAAAADELAEADLSEAELAELEADLGPELEAELDGDGAGAPTNRPIDDRETKR